MDGNRDVLELLDVLYAMVTDAWSVPLGNDKCIIEREKAVALINDIKASLPSSVAEAQRLVAARDEFIGNAKVYNHEEDAMKAIENDDVVIKGGSYINSSESVNADTVGMIAKARCSDYVGFRLVRNE